MKLLLDMKMMSYSNANKTYFHKKSFALSLVLKVRVFGTPKWATHTKCSMVRHQYPIFRRLTQAHYRAGVNIFSAFTILTAMNEFISPY